MTPAQQNVLMADLRDNAAVKSLSDADAAAYYQNTMVAAPARRDDLANWSRSTVTAGSLVDNPSVRQRLEADCANQESTTKGASEMACQALDDQGNEAIKVHDWDDRGELPALVTNGVITAAERQAILDMGRQPYGASLGLPVVHEGDVETQRRRLAA